MIDLNNVGDMSPSDFELIPDGTIARAMGMSRSTVQTIVNREVAA